MEGDIKRGNTMQTLKRERPRIFYDPGAENLL